LLSPRNAHIVYRVARVFSQANLGEMLSMAENRLLDGHQISSHRYDTSASPIARLCQREGGFTNWELQLRQNIVDFEGSNYRYQPIMGEEFKREATEFLDVIGRGWRQAVEQLALMRRNAEKASNNLRLVEKILIFLQFVDNDKQPEQVLEENQKQYILDFESAMRHFSRLFQLPVPDFSRVAQYQQSTETTANGTEHLRPSHAGFANDHERRQLLNRLKIPVPTRMGNPDTYLIQSDEYRKLVKILHWLSVFLNEKFGQSLNHLYYGSGICNRMSRYIISHPTIYVEPQKNVDSSSTIMVEHSLPPRIRLRLLGKKSVVHLITFLILLILFTNLPIAKTLLILFIFYLLYIFVICQRDLLRGRTGLEHLPEKLRRIR